MHREYVIEWIEGERLLCYWFWFKPDTQKIYYDKTETVRVSEEIRKLSSFEDMTDEKYSEWFRQNRKKEIASSS